MCFASKQIGLSGGDKAHVVTTTESLHDVSRTICDVIEKQMNALMPWDESS